MIYKNTIKEEGRTIKMTNSDYLKKIKKADGNIDYIIEQSRNGLIKNNKIVIVKFRQAKALEIIAETLIGIDDKFNSLINDEIVIN